MAAEALKVKSILDVIDARLIPDAEAKKARGEVFTPLELVREMLFGLRKSDLERGINTIWGVNEKGEFFDDDESNRVGGIPLEIWRDPDTKWLDPANGIGNFPFIAYYMLDYQLDKHGKDPSLKGSENKLKRRKHIVKNMLYMIEINKGNVNTSRKIFKQLVPSVDANIICADTINLAEEKIKKIIGFSHFDVIMGNPPFQAPQEASGKRGGGDELYMKFVIKSLSLIKNEKYLVFVHPPSWRKPEFNEGRKKSKNAGMFDLMAHDNQLLYLEIHSLKDGIKLFKAGTRYDFYLLQKIKCFKETFIKDMTNKVSQVNLNDFDFLPNFNIKNILKMFPKKTEDNCELGKFNESTKTYNNNTCVLYERSAYGGEKPWVSSKESATFKYPLIHATNQTGPKYFFSSTKDKGFFGVPKVIFGDGGINEPVIDLEGNYGMTQHAIAIVIKNKEDGSKLKTFLKSNFFKNILVACSYSSFQIDWRLFTYFKRNFWDIDVNLDEPIQTVEESLPKKTRGAKVDASRRTRKLHRFF